MSMADDSFQERLQRISTGNTHVAAGLLGQGELAKLRKAQAKGKAPAPFATMGIQEKKKFPLKRVLVSFLLGAVSFYGGSLGAFHATQSAPSEFDQYRPLIEAFGPAGMSALLALFLLYVSGFRSVWLVGVIACGFFAASASEPHLASASPQIWTSLYSAEHAEALKFKAIAQTAKVTSLTGYTAALPPELAGQ